MAAKKESYGLEDFMDDDALAELAKKKEKLMRRYNAMDKNKDGVINLKDFKNLKNLPKYMQLADTDDDGEMTFDEFWKLMLKKFYKKMKHPAELAMADRVAEEKYNLGVKMLNADGANADWDDSLTKAEAAGCPEFADAFDEIDVDGSGTITLEEAWTYYRKRMFPNMNEEVRLRALFQEVDMDRSGYLSESEVKNILNKAKDDASKIDFAALDANKDGKICIEEFMNYWRKKKAEEKAAKEKASKSS